MMHRENVSEGIPSGTFFMRSFEPYAANSPLTPAFRSEALRPGGCCNKQTLNCIPSGKYAVCRTLHPRGRTDVNIQSQQGKHIKQEQNKKQKGTR